MNLDPQQQKAHDEAVEYVAGRNPAGSYRIGGYAGTGKTTVAKEIVMTLTSRGRRVAACAFAGKAAYVLRSKGVPANTIHRTIYEYDETFRLKDRILADYILLDEASMVPMNLWNDLCSFKLPIICIGDPGQLEPIGDDARLMHAPDIVLDKIHRYSGSIEWFANHIRTEGVIPAGGGDVTVLPQSSFMSWCKDSLPTAATTFLVGKNRTRVALNKMLRTASQPLQRDDRLIVLLNDQHHGVFNGQFLTIESILDRRDNYTVASVLTDDSRTIPEMKLWHGQLHRESLVDWKRVSACGRNIVAVDYGYATTVHKFQGSEDERIVVIDEGSAFADPVRWLYTACTRATKELILFRE